VANHHTNFHGSSLSIDSADEQEIHFLDYFRVVWRYRWVVFVLCTVATVLTAAITMTSPRKYRASATIVPPTDSLQTTSGALGTLGSPLLRQVIDSTSGSFTGIYVEILNSREVADSLIDRFGLMEVYESTQHRSSARRRLRENTEVETTKDGVVKITVTDPDPNRAAAIAGAYVEELDRQNKRLSAGQATNRRLFLANRLKEIEERFSRIENIPSHEAKVQQMLYELLVREYEIAKIEEAKSMPTIQVLDQAAVPELPMPRGTIKKAMVAGITAAVFGLFLAFILEYCRETKQAGLAKQFERATRWRKARRPYSGESGNNGQEEAAVREAAGADI
jgi:uncharacterized protein involved in exopolysaccharide biosynthesis